MYSKLLPVCENGLEANNLQNVGLYVKQIDKKRVDVNKYQF